MEELLQLAFRFDPEFFRNTSSNERNQELGLLDFFNNEFRIYVWRLINLNQKVHILTIKLYQVYFYVKMKRWNLKIFLNLHLNMN